MYLNLKWSKYVRKRNLRLPPKVGEKPKNSESEKGKKKKAEL